MHWEKYISANMLARWRLRIYNISTNLLIVFSFSLLVTGFIGMRAPIDRRIFSAFIALLIALSWRKESIKRSGVSHIKFLVVGVIIIGTLFRLYSLGVPSLWFDETVSIVASMGILSTGTPTFPSGYVHWRALPYHTIVAMSMALLGENAWAARFPSVVLWISTSTVFYMLSKEILDPRVALISIVLLSFSTWEIAWSRQVRMYQALQFLTLLIVYIAIKTDSGLTNRGLRLVYIFLFIIIGLTNAVGYVLIPTTLGYLIYTSDRSKRELKGAVNIAAGAIIGIGLATVLLNTSFSGLVSGEGPIGVSALLFSLEFSYVIPYLNFFSGKFWYTLYFSFLGFIILLRSDQRVYTLYFLSIIFVSYITLSFFVRLFSPRYMYFILPFLYLAAAVTLVSTADKIVNVLSGFVDTERSDMRMLIALGMTVLLITSGSFTIIPQDQYTLGPNSPQPDFKLAYDYIDRNSAEKYVLISGWTVPAVYYNGSVEYWLSHDLTGLGRDWVINDRERFSGATPIESVEELNQTIERHDQGWVVIDSIAYRRQSPEVQQRLDKLNQHNVSARGMYVFSWG